MPCAEQIEQRVSDNLFIPTPEMEQRAAGELVFEFRKMTEGNGGSVAVYCKHMFRRSILGSSSVLYNLAMCVCVCVFCSGSIDQLCNVLGTCTERTFAPLSMW